jgi:hypothetical protein
MFWAKIKTEPSDSVALQWQCNPPRSVISILAGAGRPKIAGAKLVIRALSGFRLIFYTKLPNNTRTRL